MFAFQVAGFIARLHSTFRSARTRKRRQWMAAAKTIHRPASRAFPREDTCQISSSNLPENRAGPPYSTPIGVSSFRVTLAYRFESYPFEAAGFSPRLLKPASRMPIALRGDLVEMSTTSRCSTAVPCLIVRARIAARFLSSWLTTWRLSCRVPSYAER